MFLAYRERADLSRFEFHQIDLNHDLEALFDLLSQRRPTYVVNFASQSEVAPSWEHPEQWFRTNAVSTAALGNFLRRQTWLRRYVHISRGELAAMEEEGSSEVYNLSADLSVTIRQLVEGICDAMHADFTASTDEIAARPGNDNIYVIDSRKARTRLGWAPQVALEQGLAEVIAWVEGDWEEIRTQPLEYVHKP